MQFSVTISLHQRYLIGTTLTFNSSLSLDCSNTDIFSESLNIKNETARPDRKAKGKNGTILVTKVIDYDNKVTDIRDGQIPVDKTEMTTVLLKDKRSWVGSEYVIFIGLAREG